MYTKFFNFSANPFQLTPDPRFLFESSVHSKALAHLQFGLNQGEGFIVITGEVGAGKTTIIGHLLETLDRHKYVATTVVTTNISEDDIIRLITSGLGLPHEGRDKASMLIDIENFLFDCARRNKRCLIFVDEAQNLSIKTLEELRMLSNIHVDGQAPVQLFLLGQPQFRRTLAREDMLQLRHRVIASYHLGPLSEEDTKEYILHRLKRVGWANDPALDDSAFPVIYKFTQGVPRRINTLFSRILLFCFLEECHRIDGLIVRDVADDLENEFEQVLDYEDDTAPATKVPTPAPNAPIKDTSAPMPPQSEPPETSSPAPHKKNAQEAKETTAPQTEASLLPLIGAILPAFQKSTDADALPSIEGKRWQEVIDLIESTPVEALAALDMSNSNAANTEINRMQDPPNGERAHNKVFKRLLLLILEEYLKEAPTPEIHRH